MSITKKNGDYALMFGTLGVATKKLFFLKLGIVFNHMVVSLTTHKLKKS